MDNVKMTDSKVADVLAAHNEWRRGGDGPQTDPVTLGLALERAIARLREPAGVGGEVRAWETDDGRVISASQKAAALRDGGASASSVQPYGRPLCDAAQPGGSDND